MISAAEVRADIRPSGSTNLVILDAIRGIAAIAVVIHHFALAFMPEFQALATQGPASLFLGWLFNGIGAVYLFFVLSGFVLTVKAFQTGNPRLLVLGVIKRLPRLWPAATYGVIVGFVVLRFGLNQNEPAAVLTGSSWLAEFSQRFDADPQAARATSALWESVTLFFDNSHLVYNLNLWTMKSELAGSFLVFTCAALVLLGQRDRGSRVRFVAILGMIAAAALVQPRYSIAFMSGLILAWLYVRQRFLPRGLALCAIILGIVLLGVDQLYISTAGAVLIVSGLIVPGLAPGFLTGKVGRQLGVWSFPIYLVHTPVIASAGSLALLRTADSGWFSAAQLAASFFIVVVFTLLVAFPLVRWEHWWLPVLNRKVGAVRSPAEPRQQA